MTHRLKIWPKYFYRVQAGTKTFEVRKNDRDYQTSDVVILQEWCPDKNLYLDSLPLKFRIGYVLPVDHERVVFSLLPIMEGEGGN